MINSLLMRPRVAVQLTGLPRLCSETDRLLDCWANYEQIDWYIGFWNHNPKTLTELNTKWSKLDYASLAQEFARRLPKNNHLYFVSWYGPPDLVGMPRNYPTHQNRPENIWSSYKLSQIINLERRARALNQNITYDLIVKARSDAAPNARIDLSRCWSECQKNSQVIHTAMNFRDNSYKLCDHVIITKPSVMNIICDAVDNFDYSFSKIGIYDSSSLLGCLLEIQGIKWPDTDWESTLRTKGKINSQGIFVPDWGSWL